MTTSTRGHALRYRAITAARRELREELALLIVAAQPVGWSTLARLTYLPQATLRYIASVQYRQTLGSGGESLEPVPPLTRATLLRLTRAGRRLARLTAEQRELRTALGDAVRAMRADRCGWRYINNSLGGRPGEDVVWVRTLAREVQVPANRRRPRGPTTEDHRQALALGHDATTLTLLRVPDPTPGVRALLAKRLERYDQLDPARIARIAGIPPPARGGGDPR